MLIILSEDNYLDTINSYDKAHWKPMLDLIRNYNVNKVFLPDLMIDRYNKHLLMPNKLYKQ